MGVCESRDPPRAHSVHVGAHFVIVLAFNGRYGEIAREIVGDMGGSATFVGFSLAQPNYCRQRNIELSEEHDNCVFWQLDILETTSSVHDACTLEVVWGEWSECRLVGKGSCRVLLATRYFVGDNSWVERR